MALQYSWVRICTLILNCGLTECAPWLSGMLALLARAVRPPIVLFWRVSSKAKLSQRGRKRPSVLHCAPTCNTAKLTHKTDARKAVFRVDTKYKKEMAGHHDDVMRIECQLANSSLILRPHLIRSGVHITYIPLLQWHVPLDYSGSVEHRLK